MSTERWFPDEMPMPAASAETIEWWLAAADHRLVIQVCSECGHKRHPPAALCPVCRCLDATWFEPPGTGRVYTYTVVHQAFVPSLESELPYVVAAVELDGAEGVRLVSNIVDVSPHDVHIGMAVEATWEDMGPELAVPRFRPSAT